MSSNNYLSRFACWAYLRVRECYIHVLSLGVVRGVIAWFRIRVLKQRFDIFINVSGLRSPIVLRAGSSDLEVFKKIFINREYDLPFELQPKTILDLGANTGLASLFFHIHFPGAQIVAVEPDPANYALLQRQLAGLPGVTLIQAAVWKNDGEINLVDPGIGAWGMQVNEQAKDHGNQGAVPAISMPSLLKHFVTGQIDLLKVDIEGAEKEVFESSEAWIHKVGAIVIEMHDCYKVGCSRVFYNSINSLPNEKWVGENIFVWK
jgi:FkbM family methyltransferase